MIKTGLVSVTFRQLEVARIIELAAEAGLDGIEWGGDVHVPHGDKSKAREVWRLCTEAGIDIPSYGSYYRAGEADNPEFEGVLACAAEMQAADIRIWAGRKGSAQADEAYRLAVIKDTERVCRLAATKGIRVSYEFHMNTLTDTIESVSRLMKEIEDENLWYYWQPPLKWSEEECMQSLKMLGERVTNLHVYNWTMEGPDVIRHPLAGASEALVKYLKQANKVAGQRYAMLEFVKDDSIENFRADAQTLKKIVREANS